MKPRIYYTKPSITELEVEYATDAVRHGWGERCYEYIHRFEEAIKTHLGVRYAIATSSCTGALHMGLAAIGVGPGDEVIMADTNWIATAAPIVHLGGKPIFVDVLETSWCIDPVQVERAITPQTKAIIAVHLYGNLCEMDRLLAIGRAHGIPVIEDAAEALGSVYEGARAGSMGMFSTFSFHGSKTLTTGEGGLFATNDQNLYEQMLTLSNHGRAKGERRQFWPERVGFKYKMSNVQAAIGCGQVQRLPELVARKREILKYYRERLAPFKEVQLNPELGNNINGAWMPTAVFNRNSRVTRETLLSAFAEENIDARVFFHPLSSLPMFRPESKNTISYDLPTRAINLPSYHDISTQDLDRVIAVLTAVLETTSR